MPSDKTAAHTAIFLNIQKAPEQLTKELARE
jgi:hypothetical protein